MAGRVVAIHQPNFFPWLGYFDKIVRADVFVVLDHVQFPKSEGNWSNRVRLAVNGQPAWVTMPVVRAYQGLRRIDDMTIDDRAPWRRKLLQSLRTNYAQAAAFRDVWTPVQAWVEHPSDRVADYNLHAVTAICGLLGAPTGHIVRSSTLGVTGSGTELLVNIVHEVGGTTYLSGDGSGGYLAPDRFTAAGLAVVYQRFAHPIYPQRDGAPFLAGLSILDALMHCGAAGVARLLGVAPGAAS